MGGFSSFSWLNNIHYIYAPHLLYSLFIPFFVSIDEHLDCLHYSLLWTMLQWTWGAQISLWDLDFNSFGDIPRSGIATHMGVLGFPVGSAVKNLLALQERQETRGLIPGSRSSPGGHGNPLQCSCLQNSMDRGAWRVTVYGVAKSQTRLKWLGTYAW